MKFEDIEFRFDPNPDVEAIVNLRKAAFRKKHQNDTELDYLNWNQKDRQSYHFVAIKDCEIISCLRLYRILNEIDAHDTLLTRHGSKLVELPSFLLSRAATSPAWPGLGINLKLRLMAFQHLQKIKTGENFLYGIGVRNLKRRSILEDLGYEFFYYTPEHSSFSNKNALIFRLNINQNLDNAVCKLMRYLNVKTPRD